MSQMSRAAMRLQIRKKPWRMILSHRIFQNLMLAPLHVKGRCVARMGAAEIAVSAPVGRHALEVSASVFRIASTRVAEMTAVAVVAEHAMTVIRVQTTPAGKVLALRRRAP